MEILNRPVRFVVGIRRWRGSVVILLNSGEVRGFTANIVDGQRHAHRQFPLNIEAPGPLARVLFVWLHVPQVFRRWRGRAAGEQVRSELKKVRAGRHHTGPRARARNSDLLVRTAAGNWWDQIHDREVIKVCAGGIPACARAEDPFRRRPPSQTDTWHHVAVVLFPERNSSRATQYARVHGRNLEAGRGSERLLEVHRTPSATGVVRHAEIVVADTDVRREGGRHLPVVKKVYATHVLARLGEWIPFWRGGVIRISQHHRRKWKAILQ